jgi:hypothetical protein
MLSLSVASWEYMGELGSEEGRLLEVLRRLLTGFHGDFFFTQGVARMLFA